MAVTKAQVNTLTPSFGWAGIPSEIPFGRVELIDDTPPPDLPWVQSSDDHGLHMLVGGTTPMSMSTSRLMGMQITSGIKLFDFDSSDNLVLVPGLHVSKADKKGLVWSVSENAEKPTKKGKKGKKAA